MKEMKNKNFLLEIGVEEMPSGCILPALKQLEEILFILFENNGIKHSSLKSYATAKRLTCYSKEIETQTREKKQKITGPPVEIAFDKSGNYTNAAVGFAKKFNLNPEELKTCITQKGKYIYLENVIPSRKTKHIVSENLLNLLKKIHFPKKMRWQNNEFTFTRPIRWICSLIGEEIIPVKIMSLESNRFTYVKEKGVLKKIKINSAEDYFEKLKKHSVILDHNKRKTFIKNTLAKKIARFDFEKTMQMQSDLLNEVNFLVESPLVFKAGLKKEFLNLPKEVLLASMSKYQRVFGVLDGKGNIAPIFSGVADGVKLDKKKIQNNYQMVLESRLKDSLFFFSQDIKTPLEKKLNELKFMAYHNKLGNMAEKVERISFLSDFLARKIALNDSQIKILKRAVLLCKCDLTTFMVNEFPSLQGVMGGIYALNDGEKKDVSEAICQHYMPRYADDGAPPGKYGAIISLAERIDSLCGYFTIGLIPTGSNDPFALRRDAYAIVKIILSHNMELKLDELVQEGIKLIKDKNKNIDYSETEFKIIDFIIDKFISFFNEEFHSAELVNAVLKSGHCNILNYYQRLKDLYLIKEKEYFFKAAKVAERSRNICRNSNCIAEHINPDLFKEKSEKNLWNVYNQNKQNLKKIIKDKDYKKATKIYGNLFYKPVNDFFDEVLVNTEESDVRGNRLALCRKIHLIYADDIADLSQLVKC